MKERQKCLKPEKETQCHSFCVFKIYDDEKTSNKKVVPSHLFSFVKLSFLRKKEKKIGKETTIEHV